MVWLCSSAFALGLGLSTMEVEQRASPGESFSETIQVTNSSDHPVEVEVSLSDWWFDGPGHRFDPVGTQERSAAPWLVLSKPALLLEPGEIASVNVKGTVPPLAVEGGYYAAVFFTSQHPGQVRSAVQMGTLMNVVVGKPEPGEITCSDALVRSEGGQTRIEVPCTLKGTVHERLTLKTVARDPQGAVVARFNSDEVRYLPGQTRSLQFQADGLPPGDYRLEGVVTGGPELIRISTAAAVREDVGGR